MGELGIRKAFGGTRWNIIKQILLENMILSLIGGLIGLIISYFGMYIVREWVFTSTTYFSLNIDPDIPTKVLINPGTFIIAFLFCTLLNLLSTAIPAWRITSQPIVESLKTLKDKNMVKHILTIIKISAKIIFGSSLSY